MNISTPVQALLDDQEALPSSGWTGDLSRPNTASPVRLLTRGSITGFSGGATKWLDGSRRGCCQLAH